MKRLVALVAACALVAPAALPAEGKTRHSCGHGKRAKQHRHCARLHRAAARRPAAERLSALQPPALRGPGDSSGGGTEEGTPAPPLGRYVYAKALEWSLTLSRSEVAAGSVKIELRNNGEDPHNLVVSPDDGSHTPLYTWADTGPGTILVKSVTLTAGRYQLWCSLPDHEAQGMSVDLIVR